MNTRKAIIVILEETGPGMTITKVEFIGGITSSNIAEVSDQLHRMIPEKEQELFGLAIKKIPTGTAVQVVSLV